MFPNTIANDILKLYFNATAIANVADNAATAPLTNLYAALHSAFPGYTGTQSTSEVSYTGYARPAIARTTGGFTVATNGVALVATASMGQCTAGSATAMFATIGEAVSGASKIGAMMPLGSVLGPFTAVAGTDTITLPGLTGLAVDDRITFLVPHTGMTIPTGITEGTVYFVKTVSTNDITISTTQGGATLDITAAGDGLAFRVTPIVIGVGTTPQLASGSNFLVLR